jgi:cholesterol oxidase
MTGCRYNAKNTLDKNYLHLAQLRGAEIVAETEVVDVAPLLAAGARGASGALGTSGVLGTSGELGYRVKARSSTSWGPRRLKRTTTWTARGVVFSGGVLGTVRLLLRLKTRSLGNLSDRLGFDIRTNNETIVSVSSLDDSRDMSKGVAIGSLLHADENSHLEVVRYADGSDFWKLLHLPVSVGRFLRNPVRYLRIYARPWSRHTAVLLFMQTLDSTLRFKLGRGPTGLQSKLSTGAAPSPKIPASAALVDAYAAEVDGSATNFALETLSGIPSTAHILGGAVMGDSPKTGVIDSNNRVYGYQNMLVIDGSMISANPGVNPSLSITAIAEHAMAHVPLHSGGGEGATI